MLAPRHFLVTCRSCWSPCEAVARIRYICIMTEPTEAILKLLSKYMSDPTTTAKTHNALLLRHTAWTGVLAAFDHSGEPGLFKALLGGACVDGMFLASAYQQLLRPRKTSTISPETAMKDRRAIAKLVHEARATLAHMTGA